MNTILDGPGIDATARDPNIAVALSGGGHRAAIFGRGVLLYLVDSGLNKRVDVISSVSGGSITNGFVAQHCDFREVDQETFDHIASRLLYAIVRRGLFSGLLVTIYLALLVGLTVLAVGIATVEWPLPIPWWSVALLCVAAAGVGLFRGMIVRLRLARLYFRPGGKHTRMNDLTRTVEHIFCATDLNSNSPFYFSTWDGGYMYSPAFGFARPGRVSLSTVVRASAAFPGGIPPKRLSIRNVEFHRSHVEMSWMVEHSRDRIFGTYKPRVLFLADGGVWNNLGTQALLEDRLYHGPSNWFSPLKNLIPPLRLIVANASAPIKPKKLWRLHLPGLAELTALSRSINILTFNTVAPRVEQIRKLDDCVVVNLVDVFDRPLRSTTLAELQAVHPEDVELGKLPPDYRLWNWPELRLHQEILHEGLAGIASLVPTTLGRIFRDDAVRLLIHGYQNAQTEVYVRFGYPRVRPTPGQDRFTSLILATRRDLVRYWCGERWYMLRYFFYQLVDEIRELSR